MKKVIAITLYVIYATFLTALLIFGGDISRTVVKEVKSFLYVRDLSDVEIDIDTEEVRSFGRTYYPTYTPVGDFYNAGLTFKSLDPDVLKVSSKGAFSAYSTYDGDEATARIQITSKYDKDFEKIITLHFVKQYPETFSVTYIPKSYKANNKQIHVGIPVYVYPTAASSTSVQTSGYEILYDETYFTRREDGSIVPIAETPDGIETAFTIRYPNGAEASSKSFSIVGADHQAAEIDEIRLGTKSIEEGLTVKQSAFIVLYNKGERVYSDYTLTFGEGDNGKIRNSSSIYFTTQGEKTITITLASGFSKSFPVSVTSVLALPVLEDEELAESCLISILESENPVYKYTFPKGVTQRTVKAEYDPNMVTIKTTSSSFTVIPKRAGETSFTLYVTDGNETLYMDTITLEIKADNSIMRQIMDNISNIVTKYMGHFTLFVILAFFALNMFRYIETKSKFIRLVRYIMCALPIAAITEYAQTFIPRRTGRIEDVAIDMGGYLLGTLIGITVAKIFSRKAR